MAQVRPGSGNDVDSAELLPETYAWGILQVSGDLPMKTIVVAIVLSTALSCGKKTEATKVTDTRPSAIEKMDGTKTAPPSDPKRIVIQDVGFETPESIVHDPIADLYLVSNINGSPLEADGNGFISRINPNGQVKELKWIDGDAAGIVLNAPKGMALFGDTLYVADIDKVRRFDRDTGAPKGTISIYGATFLNGMAAGPDGTVYVSDSGITTDFRPSGSDAIYALKDQEIRPVIKDPTLGRPNGLVVDGDTLWCVTFRSGELFSVTTDGIKGPSRKMPKGSLDGLIQLPDGRLLFSSWGGSAIYAGTPTGRFRTIFLHLPNAADIGFDTRRNRVLIPLFNVNRVELRKL